MLEFYTSLLGVDIWKEIDTRTGKVIYQFFFNGKAYEKETELEAFNLVKSLHNLDKVRIRVRGG